MRLPLTRGKNRKNGLQLSCLLGETFCLAASLGVPELRIIVFVTGNGE